MALDIAKLPAVREHYLSKVIAQREHAAVNAEGSRGRSGRGYGWVASRRESQITAAPRVNSSAASHS